jgi:hypothetical protein
MKGQAPDSWQQHTRSAAASSRVAVMYGLFELLRLISAVIF